jgi:phospholipid N-methyltransferase
VTSNGKWTREAIRGLGPTTDLPTLGAILECSRWKAYQMARQGEWEQVGIKVIQIGAKYRVVVQSILDVLGYDSGDVGASPADLDAHDGLPRSARQNG